jgi:hypothetical protein
VAQARQKAMTLVRQRCQLSFAVVGETFAHRDHGTVIHAGKRQRNAGVLAQPTKTPPTKPMSELPENSDNPQKAVANDHLLAVFDGLERSEQTAWLARFEAQTNRVTKYGDKWNTGFLFGKAECGWVDFEKVWLGKFIDLGWLKIVEIRRFKALGIQGQPESAEYEFKATQTGWDVREAYWERLKSRSAEQRDHRPLGPVHHAF